MVYMASNSFYSEIQPGLPIPVYNAKGVVIGKKSNNLINLKGNYFIFEIPSFQYFHIINEKIGQFELLKDIVPNLELVCISDSRLDLQPSRKDLHNTILDMLKVYDINEDNIYFLDETSLCIENIFFYNTRINKYLINLEFPKGVELFFDKDPDKIHVDAFRKVKRLYRSELVKNKNLPQKIFITRKNLNNTVRMIHYYLNNKNNLTTEEIKDFNQWVENYGGEKYLWQFVHERYMTLEEEDRLEQFFVDKGYVIIDPAELTFFQQINYYYNAKHVASVRGSGLVNTIFCEPETNIFILDVSNQYDFEYASICRISTNNVYEIPVKCKSIRKHSDFIFSVENVLAVLENHYGDRL